MFHSCVILLAVKKNEKKKTYIFRFKLICRCLKGYMVYAFSFIFGKILIIRHRNATCNIYSTYYYIYAQHV